MKATRPVRVVIAADTRCYCMGNRFSGWNCSHKDQCEAPAYVLVFSSRGFGAAEYVALCEPCKSALYPLAEPT